MAKKDFGGKNKTSNTYDKDWVFHNGAWVTKRQRKQAIRDRKEQRRYMADIRAASGQPGTPPVPAPPPTTVPIIGGSTPTPVPAPGGGDPTQTRVPTPNISLPAAGAPGIRQERVPAMQTPSWWINAAIQNPSDPNQQFANVANALLPTLAPEDQRTLATYLATNFKDVYGGYANTNFGQAPTEITDTIRKQYLSPQRAQQALGLLDQMKTASGATEMGAGYDFLRNAINLINQFTNAQGVMGRENYDQFSNAVSGLVGQAGNDISAYANLAQLFNLPKFSAGPLISNTPNERLFS